MTRRRPTSLAPARRRSSLAPAPPPELARPARRRNSLALILAALSLLVAATPAAAVTARASLTDIESNVMCVACHEPLAVSQSPEAISERAFISMLIAQGMTKPQIMNALVAQYGPQVLAKPPAHGFNLTVYILPPAILLLGGVAIALVLPRWRRRTRERAAVAVPPAVAQPGRCAPPRGGPRAVRLTPAEAITSGM